MYKLEMHLHTYGNSSCAKVAPEEIIPLYKSKGYDGIVCTNHYNRFIIDEYLTGRNDGEKTERFLDAFYRLREKGRAEGIDVFFGLELAIMREDYHSRTRLRCVELLVYGITVEEFLKYTVKLADMNYKTLYETAEVNGWIIVQAHPFRERTRRVKAKYLHGVEVYNGHPHHIARNPLALLRAGKHNLLKTAGSDFHFVGGEGAGMTFDRRPIDEKDVVNLVKEGKGEVFHNKARF